MSQYHEPSKSVIDRTTTITTMNHEWMANIWRMRTIGPTIPSFYVLWEQKKLMTHEVARPAPRWVSGLLSFGSMAACARSLGLEQMEELAWGMKNTHCYFL